MALNCMSWLRKASLSAWQSLVLIRGYQLMYDWIASGMPFGWCQLTIVCLDWKAGSDLMALNFTFWLRMASLSGWQSLLLLRGYQLMYDWIASGMPFSWCQLTIVCLNWKAGSDLMTLSHASWLRMATMSTQHCKGAPADISLNWIALCWCLWFA